MIRAALSTVNYASAEPILRRSWLIIKKLNGLVVFLVEVLFSEVDFLNAKFSTESTCTMQHFSSRTIR